MDTDVMTVAADPFSGQYSYTQVSNASASGQSNQSGAQQQQQQQASVHGTESINSITKQPSEPIFFQGQWFTPAPPGFTPPPGPQQQHGSVQQHQAVPQPQLQQQQLHLNYQQNQSYQQPQQLLFAQAPRNAGMPSGQSSNVEGLYSGQAVAGPGLAAADTISQGEAWSPTSSYQFESPTFRNGAAHQLAPGQSGRTWGPAVSDVTRLTLPGPELASAPSQPKVSFSLLQVSPFILNQHAFMAYSCA